MQRYGFLAIWCDIANEDLADYRNWLTKEHIADRTFSPGFLGVRLFEALDDSRSHFILYATESIEVLRGPAYKAILDNPSPWTKRIMPRFGPFDRALGEQVLKVGNGFGSHVVVWRVRLKQASIDIAHVKKELSAAATLDGVASIRLFELDRSTTDGESQEKTMRQGVEGDFHYMLCVEAVGEAAARRASETIGSALDRIFPALDNAKPQCFSMFYGEAAHEGPTDQDRPGRAGT